MALVNCPECGKQVSSSADACPHCGWVMNEPTPAPVVRERTVGTEPWQIGSGKKFWVTTAAIIVVTVGFGLIVTTGEKREPFARPQPAPVSTVGDVPARPETIVDDLYGGLALDQIKKYRIAKRSGTKMDACMYAGVVATGMLQANDEARFIEWKKIQKTDCAAAGIQMP